MQPEEYEVHIALGAHVYVKMWSIEWEKQWYDIRYCEVCGEFFESQEDVRPQRLELDCPVYLRKLRAKLSKAFKTRFDKFLKSKGQRLL